ncbi:MAG: hypothetical protein KC964_07810 [Candidatus Omnitrophica bacterium]|nr:hypothetical protein [Candidatus Omnitrophota bacterium]
MISFPLPVIREWFAARWLLKNQDFIDEAVQDPHRLALWRNPLAIAIGTGQYEDGIRLMTPVVRRHPGMASKILDDAIAEPWFPYVTEPINHEECGNRIRETMSHWLSGIPTMTNFIFPFVKDGNLPPIGVGQTFAGLESAWYVGPEEKEDVIRLENVLNILVEGPDPNWTNPRMNYPSQQSAWAWRWSQDDLKSNLTSFLNFRCLHFPDTPLEKELFWAAALKLTNKGPFYTKPIPIDDLIPILHHSEPVFDLDGWRLQSSRFLDHCRVCLDNRIEAIESPWPPPDLPTESGFAWTWFTDEQLVKRMEAIFSAALQGYKRVVNAALPELAPMLNTWAALPAKVTGTVETQENPNRHGGQPWLSWWLEPLETEKDSFVEFELCNKRSSRKKIRESFEKLRKLRPKYADWVGTTDRSEVLRVHGRSLPANERVFEWLRYDLARIGWVEDTFH